MGGGLRTASILGMMPARSSSSGAASRRGGTMSQILDLLGGTLGGDASQAIGQQLGLSPHQSGQAIALALPMLLSGLTRNVTRPGGAEALLGALGPHDGSLLDNLRGGLNDTAQTHGAGILGHVLG